MFVVFDLDGTLANVTHRVHHVRKGKPDWEAFFAECVHDTLNASVAAALNAHLNAGDRVEIWSARSDIVAEETEQWLQDRRIDPAILTHMRAHDDSTPDVILKRSWLHQLHESERPDLVYDDRQRVVDMWREEGIACFQVCANWEADGRVIPPITAGALLTLMVGPSGAGKSTMCANSPGVISSDALREAYTGDFRDQSRNDDVFLALHRLAETRLSCGLPVTVDATNLRRRDRLKLVSLAPSGTAIRYIVVDRPLEDKKRTGGWRNEAHLKPDGGPTLIEAHHERFQSALPHILSGDGLPNVAVVDRRVL